MSFSFQVVGHAGSGMAPNGPEEIAAVQNLINETLAKAKQTNLKLTISGVSPSSFAPAQLDTFGYRPLGAGGNNPKNNPIASPPTIS